MGLDQIAFTRENENQPYHENNEIAYWRKHNALQGWMENLWVNKGNSGTFNCVDVVLTMEDLEHLERDLKSNSLPETYGFFFGADSRFDKYKNKKTFEFIEEAKKATSEGLQVIYSSSW